MAPNLLVLLTALLPTYKPSLLFYPVAEQVDLSVPRCLCNDDSLY